MKSAFIATLILIGFLAGLLHYTGDLIPILTDLGVIGQRP